MRSSTSHRGVSAIIVGISLSVMAGVVTLAQQGSVAAMFNDDQQRAPSLAPSFATAEVPATSGASVPLRVYLTAGDLERAFDRSEFRPDATIIPTNTDLQITASDPATQRVLISRVQKQPDVMRDLESQVATRRQQSPAPAGGDPGLLRIGIDTFVARLGSGNAPSQGAFPKTACFVATDFAKGGAVDRRELFLQDRMRQGIAACLDALDAAGARSLVLPLLGAASSTIQNSDAQYEGQRILKECRLTQLDSGDRPRHSRLRGPPPQSARDRRRAVGSGDHRHVQSGGRQPLGTNRAGGLSRLRQAGQRRLSKRAGRPENHSGRSSGELHGDPERQVASQAPCFEGP